MQTLQTMALLAASAMTLGQTTAAQEYADSPAQAPVVQVDQLAVNNSVAVVTVLDITCGPKGCNIGDGAACSTGKCGVLARVRANGRKNRTCDRDGLLARIVRHKVERVRQLGNLFRGRRCRSCR